MYSRVRTGGSTVSKSDLAAIKRLSVCLIFGLLSLMGGSATATTVGVYGPNAASSSFSEPLGQQFTVGVYAFNFSDLYAWQFDLSWDPSVLALSDIREGTALPATGPTYFVAGSIDISNGVASANADTLVGEIAGANGPKASLAYFDFTSLKAGQTSIDLNDLILLDHDLSMIATDTSAASIVINGNPVPESSSLLQLAMGLIAIFFVSSRNGRRTRKFGIE